MPESVIRDTMSGNSGKHATADEAGGVAGKRGSGSSASVSVAPGLTNVEEESEEKMGTNENNNLVLEKSVGSEQPRISSAMMQVE